MKMLPISFFFFFLLLVPSKFEIAEKLKSNPLGALVFLRIQGKYEWHGSIHFPLSKQWIKFILDTVKSGGLNRYALGPDQQQKRMVCFVTNQRKQKPKHAHVGVF